jgi:hypothetical protein
VSAKAVDFDNEDGLDKAAVNANTASTAIPDKAVATILYSLTKYSAIFLKEKIYFEIFCNRNNQLGLDSAIVVMANMVNELDVAKGRETNKAKANEADVTNKPGKLMWTISLVRLRPTRLRPTRLLRLRRPMWPTRPVWLMIPMIPPRLMVWPTQPM